MSVTGTEIVDLMMTEPDIMVPADSELREKRDMLTLLPALSNESAHNLVDVTYNALEAALNLTSPTTTPILVLADRRMVLLYDLFKQVLTKEHCQIRAISSRYAALSMFAWKKTHDTAAFVLLDDSKVHDREGTLDRIEQKLGNSFKEFPCTHKFWCVDFSEYRKGKTPQEYEHILDEVCPRLSRQVSETLADHDIPRVTEHLRTTDLKVSAEALEEMLTDPDVVSVDVTNLSLGNSSSWSYTVAPKGDFQKQLLDELGDSARFLSAMNIRVFVRLVGNEVHVRLSPYVMAHLPVAYLNRFIHSLGLPGDASVPASDRDDAIAYSAAAEIHQLASFALSRRIFPVIAEWAQAILGGPVDEDVAFSHLLLGQELDEMVRNGMNTFVSEWDANPEATDVRMRPSFDKDLKAAIIGGDFATEVVNLIKKNWEMKDGTGGKGLHKVTTAEDLIIGLHNKQVTTEEKLSWVLHCVTDGGYVSSVGAYDPKLKVWIPAWRTGESSNCPIGTIPGTGYAVNPRTRFLRVPMNR